MINNAELNQAAKIIQNGGLVAFPTETVYGLGANAYDDMAVAKIFETKGRPQFNPLIIHIYSIEQAQDIVFFNNKAELLSRHFWAGPLTFILPKKDKKISRLVSAGLDTLGIRMPSHPVAQAFLKKAGLPVAAPSANTSGHLSPTKYEHVLNDLGNKVESILQGGNSAIGVESTIVDLTTDKVVLLRAGGITKEDLEHVLNEEVLFANLANGDITSPKSPGQLLSHYAPHIPLEKDFTGKKKGKEAYLGFGQYNEGAILNLSPAGDLKEAASNLFNYLHILDNPKLYTKILVAPIPNVGLGLAINDRLRRAAQK